MVAALTHEKKEMLESKPMMDEIGIEAQSLKDRLAVLIEEDANSFDGVMKANRLPKNTDDEMILRKESIRSANKYSIEVPLETAEKSFRVLQLSEKVVNYGNPNSVSDTGVAAEVALAGVRGACLNVMINLSGLDNSSFVEKMKNRVNQLIEDSESLHKKIYKKTTSIIKS